MASNHISAMGLIHFHPHPRRRAIRGDIQAMQYKGVPHPQEISNALGIPIDRIAKLNANENVNGPHPEVSLPMASWMVS